MITPFLFFRYMAICHPFSIQRGDSNWTRNRRANSNPKMVVSLKKRTWHYLLPVIFISVAVNVPKFLEFKTTTRYIKLPIFFDIFLPFCFNIFALLYQFRRLNINVFKRLIILIRCFDVIHKENLIKFLGTIQLLLNQPTYVWIQIINIITLVGSDPLH